MWRRIAVLPISHEDNHRNLETKNLVSFGIRIYGMTYHMLATVHFADQDANGSDRLHDREMTRD
jgi:hypothetical protein